MHSMTGYGRACAAQDGRSITIELKSVNHRFLDLSLKLPHALMFLEDDIRRIISGKITRGHIDVFVTYVNQRTDAKSVEVDIELAKAYKAAFEQLEAAVCVPHGTYISKLAEYPDVMSVVEAAEDEAAVRKLVCEALNGALDVLDSMRSREGATLKLSLLQILDEIEQKSLDVDARYPETVAEFESKLKARLSELLEGAVDECRIAQEVAIMADKAAIDEETVRLRSHIMQAREKLNLDEPCGRGLDFLVQEMNREVNTISSKSQDIPITKALLISKNSIEKLREQIQNIE